MKISTSILNTTNKLLTIQKLNKTSTDYIHIDVMDGKFVPNIAMNTMKEILEINTLSKKKLDIHLMVESPKEYIINFQNMNIEYITIHLEINKNIKETIELIKSLNYKVGIALKPNTNIKKILPYLKYIDLILIMGVEPGKGGQQFLPKTIMHLSTIKKIINSNQYNIQIEVDGGINNTTIKNLKDIDIAVSGTYIINSTNYQQAIITLKSNSI